MTCEHTSMLGSVVAHGTGRYATELKCEKTQSGFLFISSRDL